MAQILAYQASVPSSIFLGTSVSIPAAPTFVTLADLGIFLPSTATFVEMKGTIGLTRTSGGSPQVTIRILRDGFPIFSTVQGLEEDYTVSELAIDVNVPGGFHVYTLEAQTTVGSASTFGPIAFSGTAFSTP